MFGLLYTLGVTIGLIGSEIKHKSEDSECKKKYKHPDGLTYIDRLGRSRLVSNDKVVFYTHDRNNDYILETVGGEMIKNFSSDKKNEKLVKLKLAAKDNRRTVYCIDPDNHAYDFNCRGCQYKDFVTGDIYVIRYVGAYTGNCYFNIKTKLYVRPTDKELANRSNGEIEKIYELIKKENERQKEYIKKYGLKDSRVNRNMYYCSNFDIFERCYNGMYI